MKRLLQYLATRRLNAIDLGTIIVAMQVGEHVPGVVLSISTWALTLVIGLMLSFVAEDCAGIDHIVFVREAP